MLHLQPITSESPQSSSWDQRQEVPGNGDMQDRLREVASDSLSSLGPCLLSLTSFREISPTRESGFLLGTLSPRLSVLPHTQSKDVRVGTVPTPTLPETDCPK